MRSITLCLYVKNRLRQPKNRCNESKKIFRDYISNQTVMLQSDDRHIEAPSQENRDE